MNQVTLLGRLTRDPERKADNAPVKLGLATNEVWYDKEGNKQSRADFHNVDFWGKQGDTILKYLNKGDQLLVIGKVQYEKVGEGEDTRTFTTIKGQRFEFIGGSNSAATDENGGSATPPSRRGGGRRSWK